MLFPVDTDNAVESSTKKKGRAISIDGAWFRPSATILHSP
jgi:hypothetical protein